MNQPKIFTLANIAEHIDATLIGDATCRITALNTLQDAKKGQLSFLSNSSYQQYLQSTQASCVILSPTFQECFEGNKLVTEHAYYAFAKATQLFDPPITDKTTTIHPTVITGNNCQIAQGATIAANVVIGHSVVIGSGTIIEAGCVIADHVIIEENVRLYPNVTIYRNTRIGQCSIIHSQVVIGSDGFGFAQRPDQSGWEKIHQLGGVDIGSHVEIGAGTTIDRGALGSTIIGDGVKLDNQIQIAHNVVIGEDTAIAGASAIAGSTEIGKFCTIAGGVGITGHLKIADHVHITAMTLVTRSIAQPGSYSSGTPMNDTTLWRKNAARFNQLDTFVRKVTRDKK